MNESLKKKNASGGEITNRCTSQQQSAKMNQDLVEDIASGRLGSSNRLLRAGEIQHDNRKIVSKRKRKSPAVPWKKPKGMPKRPLSAYNIFFKAEREKMIRVRSKGANGPGIGFANLAKTIACKWKDLDEESRSPFEALAAQEKEKYDKSVAVWRKGQKEKKTKVLETRTSQSRNTCTADRSTGQLSLSGHWGLSSTFIAGQNAGRVTSLQPSSAFNFEHKWTPLEPTPTGVLTCHGSNLSNLGLKINGSNQVPPTQIDPCPPQARISSLIEEVQQICKRNLGTASGQTLAATVMGSGFGQEDSFPSSLAPLVGTLKPSPLNGTITDPTGIKQGSLASLEPYPASLSTRRYKNDQKVEAGPIELLSSTLDDESIDFLASTPFGP